VQLSCKTVPHPLRRRLWLAAHSPRWLDELGPLTVRVRLRRPCRAIDSSRLSVWSRRRVRQPVTTCATVSSACRRSDAISLAGRG